MDWCKCKHPREDHDDGKGPCQKCRGTTIPCSEFRRGDPPTKTHGMQPTGS